MTDPTTNSDTTKPQPGSVGRRPIDTNVVSFNTLSVIAHVLFLIVIWVYPKDVIKMKGDDPFDPRNQHFQTMVETDKQPPSDELEMELEKRNSGTDGTEQEQPKLAAPGKEGRSGTRNAPNHNRRLTVGGNKKKLTLAERRERWKQTALKRGLASVLRNNNELKSLYSHEKKTVGADMLTTRGLIGSKGPAGDALGYEGLGNKGLFQGGDGPLNSNSIGRNKKGIEGINGPKGPRGKRFKRTGVDFKRKRKVTVAQLTPLAIGDLSQSVIRRLMRKNYNAFKYCYEQELLTKPGLKGKVVLSFTISPIGRVLITGVRSSTMKNSTVHNCLRRAVKRIRFPSVPSGGIVEVKAYPFVFKSN